MVRALHRAVEREVLLDEGGAERGSGDRHGDARRVVGQPDGHAEGRRMVSIARRFARSGGAG